MSQCKDDSMPTNVTRQSQSVTTQPRRQRKKTGSALNLGTLAVWCSVAKGYDKHQERLAAINLCGKDLARRAKRKCELCEANDDPRPYDTDADAEPSLDTLVLLCQRCRSVADGAKADARELRFLETAVWHELSHVGELARKMLARVDADWARATLDMF